MRAAVCTAGVRVRIDCSLPWVARLLQECCGPALTEDAVTDDGADVLDVRVETSSAPFDTSHLTLLSRSAWANDTELVMRDACTSGFDLRLTIANGKPVATYRWRPPRATHAAAIALRARFHLLARAALLQYPAMWWASTRGAVPMHAPVCSVDGAVMLLAGPAGVGKTTLLMREIEDGAVVTSDNLCVSDGRTFWGVIEPVRVEGTRGRRTTHGRREMPLPARVNSLTPNLVVVLRRGGEGVVEINRGSADQALRTLVGGTYMAGELRRYWGFSATLAAATGLGPVHPPITETAERLTRRLACMDVAMPTTRAFRLADVMGAMESSTCA